MRHSTSHRASSSCCHWRTLSATKSKPAEGLLYLGGEIVTAPVGTVFEAADGEPGGYSPRQLTGQWQRKNPGPTTPTAVIDDYWFTSCYLFGQYNQPSWEGYDIEEFGDAWLNHAGFGKAAYANNVKLCCGRQSGKAGTVLDSLSGHVKAGLFLCSENGENEAHSLGVARTGLAEDQLWAGVKDNDPTLSSVYTSGTRPNPNMQVLDVWADGGLDLRTTDVGYGTWSIKRITTLSAVDLDENDKAKMAEWGVTTSLVGTKWLLLTIKGAMLKLDSKATLFGDPIAGNEMINCSFYKNYLAE